MKRLYGRKIKKHVNASANLSTSLAKCRPKANVRRSKLRQSVKHVIVNSLKEKVGKEFDRDESAKTLITEDDLRGLELGSRLRVAENVKFTPLAQRYRK